MTPLSPQNQPAEDRSADHDRVSVDGTVTVTCVGELAHDGHNRRQHSARNIAMIRHSIQRDGTGRSIVIDEHNQILCGNATVDAATAAGIKRVRVIDTDGDELIAVRRRNLTADQKRTLAIADNRAAELATWNLEQLRADADAGLDLATFFAPVEPADLLTADAPVPKFQPTEAEFRLDELQPHCRTCTCRQGTR